MIIGILTSFSLLFGFLLLFNGIGDDDKKMLVIGIALIIIGFFLYTTFLV